MSSRFCPNWTQARAALNIIQQAFDGADPLLLAAFNKTVGPELQATTSQQMLHNLKAIVDFSSTPPWVLFQLISELATSGATLMKEVVASKVRIETRRDEYLAVQSNGSWNVVWRLDHDDDPENSEVSLLWHIPSLPGASPVVPITLMDYVAASVSLANSGLTLPGFAVMMMAIEAALWDALEHEGIPSHPMREV